MVTKTDLDREVAFLSGVPVNDVRRITSIFIDQLAEALVQHGGASIRMFGTFKVTRSHQPDFEGKRKPKVYVGVRKSPSLKKRLENTHDGQVRRR